MNHPFHTLLTDLISQVISDQDEQKKWLEIVPTLSAEQREELAEILHGLKDKDAQFEARYAAELDDLKTQIDQEWQDINQTIDSQASSNPPTQTSS